MKMKELEPRRSQYMGFCFFSGFRSQVSSFGPERVGFTLIELLVVLVILMIVTSVSMTSIPSFASPRQKLRSDARELLSLLQESRQTAMLRKMKIDVCVDLETGTVRAIESVWSRRLISTGESLFDEESIGTNVYSRSVSFGEDIELDTFPAEAVQAVLSSEDDPFGDVFEQSELESGERVAITFTHFGGASGGGVSLIREDARLDIACDILTGEPEIVDLYSTGAL